MSMDSKLSQGKLHCRYRRVHFKLGPSFWVHQTFPEMLFLSDDRHSMTCVIYPSRARARFRDLNTHACMHHAESHASCVIAQPCMSAHAHACIVHASVGTWTEVCPDGVAVAMAVTMHPDVYNTHG
eukprot:SAG11_NODE_902_length_6620_cov_3.401012_6_plen_126_part_00